MRIPRGRPLDLEVQVQSISLEMVDQGDEQFQLNAAWVVPFPSTVATDPFPVFQYDQTSGWEEAVVESLLRSSPIRIRISAGPTRLLHTAAPPGTSSESFLELANKDSLKRHLAGLYTAQSTYYKRHSAKILLAQKLKRLALTQPKPPTAISPVAPAPVRELSGESSDEPRNDPER